MVASDASSDEIDVYFIFCADPLKIGTDKREFGRLFRKDGYAPLRKISD
jgi:hypothetical protein